MIQKKESSKKKNKNSLKQHNHLKRLTIQDKFSKENILIVGLPGVSNISRASIEYILNSYNAKPVYNFKNLKTNFVIVKENNTIYNPKLEIFKKKINKNNFYFLTGDYHPTEADELYSFITEFKRVVKKFNIDLIVTLGVIIVDTEVKHPKIFATSNSKKCLSALNEFNIKTDIANKILAIYGATGKIIVSSPVSGALILVEVNNFSEFTDLKSVKAMLKTIIKLFGIEIDLKRLNKDIKNLDKLLIKNFDEGKNKSDCTYIG